jgi:hypothetical protein
VVYRKGLTCSPHQWQGRHCTLLERQVLLTCPSSSSIRSSSPPGAFRRQARFVQFQKEGPFVEQVLKHVVGPLSDLRAIVPVQLLHGPRHGVWVRKAAEKHDEHDR